MAPSGTLDCGRYELLTLLGEGGMARVYLAVSHGPVGFNKLVVIKQIRPELASDHEFLAMFLNEARIALRLNHPNVVQTYELFEEDGHHVMAMEYLEGQTLAEVLRRVQRANMPLEEHLWILCQTLAGLHYAHELRDFDGTPLGVIHRDVSPSNVFVTYDGQVKLVDFGIAKAAGAASNTGRGTVKGKLGYGAPEQFLSQAVDGRTDVFSVGVMLWEAVAGRRRKSAETRTAMIEARVAGLEPKIRSVCPEVTAPLAEICDRATALNPRNRFQSAAELQLAIEGYLSRRVRQVGRNELADLMNHFFAADRQAIHRRIELQLGGSDRSPTRELEPLMPGPVPAVGSESDSHLIVASHPPSHSQIYSVSVAEAAIAQAAAARPRRRARFWAAAGGVAALAATAALLWPGRLLPGPAVERAGRTALSTGVRIEPVALPGNDTLEEPTAKPAPREELSRAADRAVETGGKPGRDESTTRSHAHRDRRVARDEGSARSTFVRGSLLSSELGMEVRSGSRGRLAPTTDLRSSPDTHRSGRLEAGQDLRSVAPAHRQLDERDPYRP